MSQQETEGVHTWIRVLQALCQIGNLFSKTRVLSSDLEVHPKVW